MSAGAKSKRSSLTFSTQSDALLRRRQRWLVHCFALLITVYVVAEMSCDVASDVVITTGYGGSDGGDITRRVTVASH